MREIEMHWIQQNLDKKENINLPQKKKQKKENIKKITATCMCFRLSIYRSSKKDYQFIIKER